jgi:hypothetical protein
MNELLNLNRDRQHLSAGSFLINNIAFYPDADVALGMKAEDDWKRQGLYMGPAVSRFPSL